MALLRGVGLLALLVSVQCLSREQLFDYGLRFGDQILDSGTDSVQELALDQTLFFFKEKFNKVYVGTNGFISMAKPTDESEYLGKMPASIGMIAAFLGDLDTSDGAGNVYFRQDTSPDVLQRAAEHIGQAFPSDDGIEPIIHAIIITWENVAPQSERGEEYEFTRNTFQLVVANMETASYAILLYPEEGMQFGTTLINDEWKLIEVGFNEGRVTGWFSWAATQGVYYRIAQDSEESLSALAQETNSGRPGVWVYEIGTSPIFTSITSGEVTEVREVTEVTTEQTMVDTPAPEPSTLWTRQTSEAPIETSSPEPFAESSTPDEPQYRYVQPRLETPQQQPQNPQVLIIDEDELNVDGSVISSQSPSEG